MEPDVRCPKCRLFNPPGTERCECGYDFSTETAPAPAGISVVYRVGNDVVVGNGGTLPPRCIKCNDPAHGKPIPFTFLVGRRSAVHHAFGGWWFISPSPRAGRVYVNLCRWHRQGRALVTCGIWVLRVLLLAMVFWLVAQEERPPRIKGIYLIGVLWVGLGLLSIYRRFFLRASAGPTIRISGAGRAFIESLPSAPVAAEPAAGN